MLVVIVIRQEPALQLLSHHRGRDREMQRRYAVAFQRLWVQLSLHRGRVLQNAEPRAGRERSQIPRTLSGRRPVNELRRITFDDPIRVAHAQLMLIHEQPVRRRLALEERERAFHAPETSDERSEEQRNDAEMRDEKRHVMLLPRPARERRDGEIGDEKKQPEIKPRRAVDISARHLRIESRFPNRARDAGHDEHRQQHHRQLERSEELENAVALPAGAAGGESRHRAAIFGERRSGSMVN